ncbi:MAG TPA: succinylglutamate desuccinylase/aspartoacylase family protein [Polyangiales bacterium]|nr:succinylglutamate desuccinylase/aspartoacylase family protein [Polyangiales bacterium]
MIRIASSAALPRPHVAVFGGVHGSEPCGPRAFERFCRELAEGELELAAGTLYIVHGNPKAHVQGRRHTLGGVDLNRLFDYRFLTDVPEEHWVYEHHRALALRPVLESVDVLLDLHSMTRPWPAYAMASPLRESRALADALGLAYVTEGWDAFFGERTSLTPLARRGLPAVAVECGERGHPESAAVAYECMRRALNYLGVVAYDAPQQRGTSTYLQLCGVIHRPSASFQFARPLAGMQQLAAGELIGHDEHVTITARRDCYAITPLPVVPVGEPMMYIAEPALHSKLELDSEVHQLRPASAR